MHDIAVTMTVNDRPYYLKTTLDSWARVRRVNLSTFVFNVEPTEYTAENVKLIQDFKKKTRAKTLIFTNKTKLGVHLNPYCAFERAFKYHNYAILAEEDLPVSDDILEYHAAMKNRYAQSKDIAMVCSFTEELGELNHIRKVPSFHSVLVWGTWYTRWWGYMRDTWDKDGSTGYGHQIGWDWNLNVRVLPERHKYSIAPCVSRVQNIGEIGTHSSQGQFFVTAPRFTYHKPTIKPVDYVEKLGWDDINNE